MNGRVIQSILSALGSKSRRGRRRSQEGCPRFNKFLKSNIHLSEKVRLKTAFEVEGTGMSPLLYLGRLFSDISTSILPSLTRFLKCAPVARAHFKSLVKEETAIKFRFAMEGEWR